MTTTNNENYLSDETRELIRRIESTGMSAEAKQQTIDTLKTEDWQTYRNRKPLGTDRPRIESGKVLGVEEYAAARERLVPGYADAKKRVLEGLAESKKRFGAAESVNRGAFDYSINRDKAESQRVQEWAERKKAEIEATREARTQREIAAYDNATGLQKREVLRRLSPAALEVIKGRTG